MSSCARLSDVYYGRFSDLKQSDTSIEDQFAQLGAHSVREGWTTVRKFEERAIPGASAARRPQYQTLLQTIRNRGCDVVFAEALDRLSRDQEDTAALYKHCMF